MAGGGVTCSGSTGSVYMKGCSLYKRWEFTSDWEV